MAKKKGRLIHTFLGKSEFAREKYLFTRGDKTTSKQTYIRKVGNWTEKGKGESRGKKRTYRVWGLFYKRD